MLRKAALVGSMAIVAGCSGGGGISIPTTTAPDRTETSPPTTAGVTTTEHRVESTLATTTSAAPTTTIAPAPTVEGMKLPGELAQVPKSEARVVLSGDGTRPAILAGTRYEGDTRTSVLWRGTAPDAWERFEVPPAPADDTARPSAGVVAPDGTSWLVGTGNNRFVGWRSTDRVAWEAVDLGDANAVGSGVGDLVWTSAGIVGFGLVPERNVVVSVILNAGGAPAAVDLPRSAEMGEGFAPIQGVAAFGDVIVVLTGDLNLVSTDGGRGFAPTAAFDGAAHLGAAVTISDSLLVIGAREDSSYRTSPAAWWSSDGVTWTEDPGVAAVSDVATYTTAARTLSDGRVVAVGNRSNDGVPVFIRGADGSWSSSAMAGVNRGDGKFVVEAGGATIIGLSPRQLEFGSTAGTGLWQLGPDGSTSAIAVADFTPQPDAKLVRSLLATPSGFALYVERAGADPSAPSVLDAYTSVDGTAWVHDPAASPPIDTTSIDQPSAFLTSGSAAGTVIVAEQPPQDHIPFVRGADGAWASGPPVEGAGSLTSDLARVGSQWVMSTSRFRFDVASQSSASDAVVLTSTDGLNWTEAATFAGTPMVYGSRICALPDGRPLVIGSRQGATPEDFVTVGWVPDASGTWQEVTPPGYACALFGGQLIVAAAPSDGRTQLFATGDGVTYAPWGAGVDAEIGTLVASDRHLGALPQSQGELWTTADGTAWLTADPPIFLREVVATGGSFLATGSAADGSVGVVRITPPT